VADPTFVCAAPSPLLSSPRAIMKRDGVLTPAAVTALIAEGHLIVIFEDNILQLDSWLAKHPGGRLAILHMVVKDATDEIKA
jgi:delta8-fatty-acid desaturase